MLTECEEVLHSINENHLEANLSIKLTQFGLKIDEEFCYSNVKRLLEIASGYNNFVRIDMENSLTTSETLKLYEKLRSEGFENVGLVIQANMRRSEEDVQRQICLKANIRLCKGAYLEPEAIAFKGKEEIRLLYGVRSKLRDKIVADGHRLRVYVPFGQYWYAYSMRRFKENPQILPYVFRALFSGN